MAEPISSLADAINPPRSPARGAAAERELRAGDAEAIRHIFEALIRRGGDSAIREAFQEWKQSRFNAEALLNGHAELPEGG